MLTRYQKRALALIRSRVCLENASIGFKESQVAEINKESERGSLPNHTKQIREATRLFRESWILPLIDDLLSDQNPLCRSSEDEAAGALKRWELGKIKKGV